MPAPRRPWITLGAWVVALVISIGAVVVLLDLTTSGEVTANPESERGYDAIGRHFPPDPQDEYVDELIVIRAQDLTVDDPAFRSKVEAVVAAVQATGRRSQHHQLLREP